MQNQTSMQAPVVTGVWSVQNPVAALKWDSSVITQSSKPQPAPVTVSTTRNPWSNANNQLSAASNSDTTITEGFWDDESANGGSRPSK